VDIGDINLWEKEPFSGEISDGKVFGRGASDQKGGASSMVTAAKIIKESGLTIKGSAIFTCTVQEEDCDGLCWQYIINEDKIRPDVVVLTEPTDGKINRGQRGRMELEVHTSGISCHGSAPERGDNAIYKLAPILSDLEKLNEKLSFDQFLGKGTLTTSKLYSSSPSLCAVADGAAVHIDRRLTFGESKDSVVDEILRLPSVKKYDGKVRILEYSTPSWKDLVYKTEKVFPVWILDENHQYLDISKDCYKGLFAREPIVDKWTFSTNGVSTMGMFDIPSFGYGPGFENQAHAPNEYCPVEHLTNCAAFYAAFALSFKR
ncbi:MAG: YgeY family selenium metabolism-linked hydrolase, partial [candidate division Zixibacteria bacterium]|nr:YgeY family selenium metabolism-linked hydrolase [candidate division Zixibacteria bacterium]